VALSTQVVYKFDRAAFAAIVGPGLKKDITSRTARVRTLARALAPKGKTGRLRRSLQYDVDGTRLNWTGTVYINEAIAPHGPWVALGTGVYGQHRRVIRPRVAPYMVFEWRGRWVSRKTVKGQPRQNFLPDALRAARDA